MPATMTTARHRNDPFPAASGDYLETPVRDFMTPGVLTIAEYASLRQVYRAMVAHSVHAVLVVGRTEGRALGWVTARGAKHLKALSEMVEAGARAVMVYFVQRGDAQSFTLAHDVDPAYARAFHEATSRGVEAIAVASQVTLAGLALPRAMPLQHPPAPETGRH